MYIELSCITGIFIGLGSWLYKSKKDTRERWNYGLCLKCSEPRYLHHTYWDITAKSAWLCVRCEEYQEFPEGLENMKELGMAPLPKWFIEYQKKI